MPRRIKFTVEYEADMDDFPGWGYQADDWHELAMSSMLRQSHYNTEARVIYSKEIQKVYVEGQGWVTPESSIPETKESS